MITPDTSFTYQHAGWYGDLRGKPVTVRPIKSTYLAWRLKLAAEEAVELQSQRQEHQKERLTHFVGEYVIDGLGYGGVGLQETHIGAVVAHREALGLGEQVYGGYRGINFVRHGTLFGPYSDKSASSIDEANTFCAAQVENWREQAGFAKNNPFDHMTRGDTPEQRAPILASFAIDMLDSAATWEKGITNDTFFVDAKS